MSRLENKAQPLPCAVLVLLLSAAWSAPGAAGESPDASSPTSSGVAYDISDLLQPVMDYPAPALGVLDESHESKVVAEGKPSFPALPPEEIVTRIRDLAPASQWKEARLEVRGHKLLVSGIPEVQDKIRALLSEWRKTRGPWVLVETRILGGAKIPELCAKLGVPLDRPMSNARVTDFIQAVRKEQTTDQLIAPRLTMYDGQLAHSAAIQEEKWSDEEARPPSSNAKRVRTGITVQVRPRISKDGAFFTLHLKVASEVLVHAKADKRSDKPHGERLPELYEHRIESMLSLSVDHAVLVEIPVTHFAGTKSQPLYALLTAKIVDLDEGKDF